MLDCQSAPLPQTAPPTSPSSSPRPGRLHDVITNAATVEGDQADPSGANDSANEETTVLGDNAPPIVDAGADASGDSEGAFMAIAGTASDPDDDPLTTTWDWSPGTDVDAGDLLLRRRYAAFDQRRV